MTNFEDCKKVFKQYLEGTMTELELENWAAIHCDNCRERVCHCNECPLFVNGECKFCV